jgi:nucleoid-associated protein YgaU
VRRDHAAAPGERTRVVRRGDAAAPGERTHVVRRGESLWSIARDVLGGTASTVQVAREVNRLWELNKDRIGTGDRDLLVIGTRLRLR